MDPSSFGKRLVVIAGATRSATSSLHSYLGEHPDVAPSLDKELWYFNTDENYCRGIDWYSNCFRPSSESQLLCEATPMYLTKGIAYRRERELRPERGLDAIERMARDFPECRVILSLRNPYSRIVSMYRKMRNQGKLSGLSLEDTITNEWERNASGDYCSRVSLVYPNLYDLHLSHLLKHFPRSQVMVLLFEEWVRSPIESMRDLFLFLNIDDAFLSDKWSVIHNSERVYTPSKFLFDRPKKANLKGEELTPSTEFRLAQELNSSIESCQEILGRDLRIWKK